MEESRNKELKVKSFRVTEETFDKFKKIASDEFGNQGQCLDALISLYELENSKSTLIERKLEIESFQDYLNKINQLFLTSLQMSEDAGKRAEEEFFKKLSIKDVTIERLQRREEELIERDRTLKEDNKAKTKEIEELKENIKTLEKDKKKELELLETKYSKMAEKESEKLRKDFESRLELEKRTLELDIKTLKYEKEVLESKLNS